jgi:hypothetical protein
LLAQPMGALIATRSRAISKPEVRAAARLGTGPGRPRPAGPVRAVQAEDEHARRAVAGIHSAPTARPNSQIGNDYCWLVPHTEHMKCA